jgi:hypothetical protein
MWDLDLAVRESLLYTVAKFGALPEFILLQLSPSPAVALREHGVAATFMETSVAP